MSDVITVPAEPTAHARDSEVYAAGLRHWHADRHGLALEVWTGLSVDAQTRLSLPLEAARLRYVVTLVSERKLGEALAQLNDVQSPNEPALAISLRRALVGAAWRAGQHGLARAAMRSLATSREAIDRWLGAACMPPGPARLLALRRLELDDALDAGRAHSLRRMIAAEAWSLGRVDILRQTVKASTGLLDGVDGDRELRLLARVTGTFPVSSSGIDDCDAALPASLSDDPSALALDQPGADADAEAAATFWLTRGDLDAAHHALGRVPWRHPLEPRLVHARGVVAYGRALRALPQIDVAAWKDCFAYVTAFVENESWLGGWVASRLAAFGSRDDVSARAAELKRAVMQMLDRQLTSMGTATRVAGDSRGAGSVSELTTALALERGAAAALTKAGGCAIDGKRLGFGPLFAERAGLGDTLRAFFSALPPPQASVDQDLLDLFHALGRGQSELREMLASRKEDPSADCRRWFSELGLAVALGSAGQPEHARSAALEIYVRWSPPDRPALVAFAAANIGYAGLAESIERLRSDAARTVSRMGIAALRLQLGREDIDIAGVTALMRTLLNESVGLHCESDARERLSALILGKQRVLLGRKTLEALSTAALLMRNAHATGLDGLAREAAVGLQQLSSLLARHRRYGEACHHLEEACKLEPQHETLATNWIALMCKHHEQLLAASAKDAAAKVLRRIDEATQALVSAHPESSTARQLRQAVDMLRIGVPLSEIMQIEPGGPPEVPPPEPAAAATAIAKAREAGTARRFDELGNQIDLALSRALQHPTTVAAAAELVARLAVSLAETGAALFDRVFAAVEGAMQRYPDDAALPRARVELLRCRCLFHAPRPVDRLHRKALLLFQAGDPRGACSLLESAIALSPRREVEPCILLADALIRRALIVAQSSEETAPEDNPADDIDLASQLLDAAARFEPEHPRIQDLRAEIAGLVEDDEEA